MFPIVLVTRKDLHGTVWGTREAVDRETALRMATRWGGEYVLRESEIGSLEPGKLADLIVVDRDDISVPIDDLPKTRALLTLVGGISANRRSTRRSSWLRLGELIDLLVDLREALLELAETVGLDQADSTTECSSEPFKHSESRTSQLTTQQGRIGAVSWSLRG